MKTTTTTEETIQDTADRIARLGLTEISESRMRSLVLAHESGVDDETFGALGRAVRLARQASIVLPAHRFESLSRGRGWARQGRGDGATWGERVDGGYRVGTGRWSVGATDGFQRKNSTIWDVEHITVGDQTWTIAN